VACVDRGMRWLGTFNMFTCEVMCSLKNSTRRVSSTLDLYTESFSISRGNDRAVGYSGKGEDARPVLCA
jgi:hypothetical protein